MSRARSVSRSRVTRLSSTVDGEEILDPVMLLEDILSNINDVTIPLIVCLSDNSVQVNYLLETFLRKEYPIRDGFVKFGLKRLNMRELKVQINYSLTVNDDYEEPF